MLTLKKLLLKDSAWFHYLQHYNPFGVIREVVVENVIKVLSCKHFTRGHAQYQCANKGCDHEKRVPFQCRSRLCSDCGRKATDQWIATQKSLIPPCPFQHITLTMPSQLWPLLKANRALVGKLATLAGQILLTIAKAKNLMPGVFMANHTFGRKLNWNVHYHVSVTTGGLTEDEQWRSLYYKTKTVMKMWRYEVIRFLRQKYAEGDLVIPSDYDGQNMHRLFAAQYKKMWRVHCAKPHKNPKKDLKYFARYIKRAVIANSRLQHYNGQDVLFSYLDHRTKTSRYLEIDVFNFIDRLTQHIPEKRERLIRYFGFLANRNRARLLPIVHRLFNSQMPEKTKTHSWQFLFKQKTGIDPLQCILCKSQLRLASINVGLSSLGFHQYHQKLAQNKGSSAHL